MECRVLQYTVGARLAADVEHSIRYFAGARAILKKDCSLSAIRIRRNGSAHGRRPVSAGGVLRGLVGRFVSGSGPLNACKCCLDVSSEVRMWD